MGIFDWLFTRTPADNSPGLPYPESVDRIDDADFDESELIEAILDEIDVEEEMIEHEPLRSETRPKRRSSLQVIEELEPVYTIIDYRDAKGHKTRRRITMQTLKVGTNGPLLQAICHERNSVRTFRCDRIEGFIEDDGEVISCPTFFMETMWLDLNNLAPKPSADEPEPSAYQPRQILDRHKPALSVLVAAARSDRDFRPEELGAICTYVENEEIHLHPEVAVDLECLEKVETTIRRMRPRRGSLSKHISAISTMDQQALKRFNKALNAVVAADGAITSEEFDFLQELEALRHP